LSRQRNKGAHWRRLRRAVFERDKYQCQGCGLFGQVLECDHKLPLDEGGTDDMSNLQALCVSCHFAKTRRENLVHVVEGQDEWAAFEKQSPWRRRRHA